MDKRVRQFVVGDPRDFDGDPFEVAERSLRQSAAVAAVMLESLKGARLMVRNAEMERQIIEHGECSAADFEDTAQARRLDDVSRSIAEAEKSLHMLARAAGYNPKKPVKA